jgi:hypothetical protein
MQKETNEKILSLWESARGSIRVPDSIRSKIEALKWAALRRWGMLFRAIFISSLGIGGYFWLDPQPIGDVSFSQLTLNQVFSNLFAFLLAVGCFCWFVNFPKQKKNPKSPDDNPYVIWGMFSVFIPLVALIVSMIALFSVPLLGVLQEMFGAISVGW